MRTEVRLLLTLILQHTGVVAGAQSPPVHAIVREHEMTVVIKDGKDVRVRYRRVITVLDEKGAAYGHFQAYTSLYAQLSRWKSTLTDGAGKVVSKAGRSDLLSHAAPAEVAFHTDLSIKYYPCNRAVFPYTIEQEWETSQDHTLFLPEWEPQPGPGCRVEGAKLVVEAPPGYDLRYLGQKAAGEPVVAEVEQRRIWTWLTGNIPAYEGGEPDESGSGAGSLVRLTVSPFAFGDFTGSFSSWQDFGAFIYRLNAGRSAISPALRATLRTQTAGISGTREKVEFIYRYLQQHTRYLSLEYGIGGWQTLEAAFVEKNGTGDCKALVNYGAALLEAVGISAYPVLISAGAAGYRRTLPEFPSNAFNHVILCVPDPGAKDTIWLECTSPTSPAGYLGAFTEDRWGLLFSAAGGRLVRTPQYSKEQNTISTATTGMLDNGLWRLQVRSRSKGLYSDRLMQAVEGVTGLERETWLNQRFDLPSYTVLDYHFSHDGSASIPETTEEMTIEARGYERSTSSTMAVDIGFLPLAVPQGVNVAAGDGTRLHIGQSFTCVDTALLRIPEGYKVAGLPLPVSRESAFAGFTTEVIAGEKEVMLVRRYRVRKGDFTGEDKVFLTGLGEMGNAPKHRRVTLRKL